MTRDRPVRSAALSQVLGKSFLVCDVLRDTLGDGGIVKFLIWIFSFKPFGKVMPYAFRPSKLCWSGPNNFGQVLE